MKQQVDFVRKRTLRRELSKPIPGAVECTEELRKAEVIVGCDTGYYAGDSAMLNKKLEAEYGLKFDVTTNAEIVPGRPTPFMVYDCMRKAEINTIESVVKIDDTAAAMLCGNNAGCWTIGLYASGSNDYNKLAASKPDFLVPDISYVPEVIFGAIEPALRAGKRPGQGILEVI